MPPLWRAMALVGGIAQVVAGYSLVALFELTGSYVPIFLIGGAAMAVGAVAVADLKPGGADRGGPRGRRPALIVPGRKML